MGKKKSVLPPPVGPVFPRSFETFRKIGVFEEGQLRQEEPSVWNGNVSVVKYRVTVEIVEEPIEEIHARIQKLHNESTNPHHLMPLKQAATKFGYTIKGKYDI